MRPRSDPEYRTRRSGTGKITEKCVQAFSGRTAMAFHTFVWLDGPVLNVPINARIFLSFCSRPESAERVAPHLPFYIARKGPMTLYLLGTLHVGNASDYPRPERFRPAIRAALKASPALAFELSPDDLILSQDDVQRYGMCAYPCLRRLAPAALWRRLAQRLRDHPAEFAEIKKARPW